MSTAVVVDDGSGGGALGVNVSESNATFGDGADGLESLPLDGEFDASTALVVDEGDNPNVLGVLDDGLLVSLDVEAVGLGPGTELLLHDGRLVTIASGGSGIASTVRAVSGTIGAISSAV